MPTNGIGVANTLCQYNCMVLDMKCNGFKQN